MSGKEFDKSAYVLYHTAQTGYPCLSFDVICDDDGSGEARCAQEKLSLYLVAGTQAPTAKLNAIHLLFFDKLSKFKKKVKNEASDDEDEDDDDEDEDSSDDDSDDEDNLSSKPNLRSVDIPHPWGEINRIRHTTIRSMNLTASWCASGTIRLWNLTRSLLEFKNSNKTQIAHEVNPIFTFQGHSNEGFGLDWSQANPGYLASGDLDKNIHIWKPIEAGSWHVEQTPLMGHTASVEDIQWSPTEGNILASCSIDKSIRVWDIRRSPLSCNMLTISDAHESDVNVISWNKRDPAFLVSGGDDGVIKIWDFRKFADTSKKSKPIALFKYHCTPITSVEWDPSDSSVFCASGEDQITIWDLSAEAENDEPMQCDDTGNNNIQEENDENELDDSDEDDEAAKKYKNVPPQLLFIHEGQQDVKEIHIHPQIPGLIISTSSECFDVFKTISA